MSPLKNTQKGEQIKHLLTEEPKRWGRVTGFVQRTSKVTASLFTQVMILSCLKNPEATLNEMVQMCGELGVEVSEAGWQQRLTDQAVELMGVMLGQAVKLVTSEAELPATVLSHFTSMQLLDSTEMNLPKTLREQLVGTKLQAALKLQVNFDYLAGVFRALELTQARTPDQTCTLHVEQAEAGSLHVFDLGYFKQEVLACLAALGAFFICRLQTQTALYLEVEQSSPLDLLAFLQTLSDNHWEGWLYLGRKTHLPVRLLAARLPVSLAEERRRKARQKARRRGEVCSERQLALLGWSLFITNVPQDWLTFDQVGLLYRVRWQIELLFKLCKSQAKLSAAGQWSLPRFLCQFYARLMGIVLFHGFASPLRVAASRELSFPKAFACFQQAALDLARALSCPPSLHAVLARLERDFLRFALKSQRKKSPSTFQSLLLSGA